jgi:superfamily II DNA or RNA helicase
MRRGFRTDRERLDELNERFEELDRDERSRELMLQLWLANDALVEINDSLRRQNILHQGMLVVVLVIAAIVMLS